MKVLKCSYITMICFITLITLCPVCSFADTWVEWEHSDGGNGHFYKAVIGYEFLTWTEANTLAQAEGGYLATITSQEENAFVFSLIETPEFWTGNGSGPAIGGLQADGAEEPGGGWYWTTGEAWTGAYWQTSEPDNWPGGPWSEDRLEFFSGIWETPAATWNDIGKDDPNLGGFIIERNEATPVKRLTWGGIRALSNDR